MIKAAAIADLVLEKIAFPRVGLTTLYLGDKSLEGERASQVGPMALSGGLAMGSMGPLVAGVSKRRALPISLAMAAGGAGLGALSGKWNNTRNYQSGFSEGRHVGSGELYGQALGGGLGALPMLAVGPRMAAELAKRNPNSWRYFSHMGLPLATIIAGGILGGYLGNRYDQRS